MRKKLQMFLGGVGVRSATPLLTLDGTLLTSLTESSSRSPLFFFFLFSFLAFFFS